MIVLSSYATCAAEQDGSVSLASLLEEMVDRSTLARVPEPYYSCKQFSSYDRDAVAPDQPGWFANWDRSEFLRIEEVDGRTEYVMMDAEGPGAVVRIWATWYGYNGGPFSNGTLRFYLDGSDTPAIEGPITDILDGGALVGPPLANGVSQETEYNKRGHNLYLPIPYAQHCKITYSTGVPVHKLGHKHGECLYYQINYRTYEPGTVVETFEMKQLDKLQQDVERVQKVLTVGATEPHPQSKSNRGTVVQAGTSTDVLIEGPAAITEVILKLSATDMPQALRSTVLEITFDGERTVWCPVGDFFGIGYQLRPVRTWYTQVDEDGTMTSRWVMPFAKSCRITLHSLGDKGVEFEYEVRSEPWDWDDRSIHFHAAWRHYPQMDTRETVDADNPKGARDMNFVEVTGEGVYVGDSLVLFNGINTWWGEGDEKIYVDGERFPSHFGTGTEDYYGYAWSRPEPFSAPFHAQPEGGGNMLVGYAVNSRYRALDAIPFNKSLKLDMELWHHGATTVDFTPTMIWYARKGATANIEPDRISAARPVTRLKSQIVDIKVKGASEGETMRVESVTGGNVSVQHAPPFSWSDDRQLWWMDATAGDTLELAFDVEQAGRYKIRASLTTAPDYGIVDIAINDNPPTSVDLYKYRVYNPIHDLGVVELKKGANRIRVEVTGTNPDADPRHGFGLDYLMLEPAP